VPLKVNAKVNLFLAVGTRRNDGFHEIRSVFHSVSLSDVLDVMFSDDEVTIDVRGGDAGPDRDNLAVRAARAYLGAAGLDRGVHIVLEKSIPIGGGMAGGSADAAGVLFALDRLDGSLDPDQLYQMAASLGSDVPYCLTGGPAVVTGRGEQVEALSASAKPLDLVVCISDHPLSTAAVYERWDAVGETSQHDQTAMVEALMKGDPRRVASLLHNDLEAAALDLRPHLLDGKQALLDAGALGASVSGSGPSLFGICIDHDHATDVAGKLDGRFDRVQVVQTRPRGIEPR
jgi:4-diphosphocytidyl-2-C-methyl-D-erythritol kinase